MFFHLFKYKLIELFHSRETILWILAFPLALGTLFYMGFGNMLQGSNDFEPVPVAVVSEETSIPESGQTFKAIIEELSKENDDQLFDTTWTTDEKAKNLLKEEKVDGIFYLTETPSLTLKENGLNQSILNTFLSQYLSQSYFFTQIAKEQPQNLEAAVNNFQKEHSFNKEISVSDNENDSLIQYFYALVAMVCLFGHLLGAKVSLGIQPHLSAIGARKNVTPVHKLKIILADFWASVLVNYLSVLILFSYMIFILRIDFGNRMPQVLLASLVGSIIGVSLGTFSTAIGKGSQTTKEGIAFAITMLCCFLGGLMVNTMPNILEHSAPWVNRINPATLLTDCFYSLNVYSSYDRYLENLISMLIIAAILCFGSYLMLRRKTAD